MASESDRAQDASELHALEGRLEALRVLNAELEERIAARTRELSAVSVRFETVVHELPVGVLVLGTEGAIELANRPALEILGVDREELAALAQRQPWRMYARDGRELALRERPIFRALSSGAVTSAERFLVERSDGVRLVVELSAVPLNEPDGNDAVIVTIQDVTEREALERAERDFVTNAAHELQTPLAAIVSAVEVLQGGAKESPEDRDLFLRHISDASRRLERLTRALLMLARVEVGEQVRTEVVALAPLLAAAAAGAERDRELQVECEANLAVITNRTLLEQALVNLIDNAVKHTQGKIQVGAERAGDRVKVVVRDSGQGIADADQPHVFERFYRGEGTTRGGAGLGLAIVASVAQALGGELELESSATGTSVAIQLPAARLVSR